MANRFRFPLLALLLGLALLCIPLRAQLNPKLQASNTDFLNLYQQSTNTKVKPEVLTIFDFSGSMDALMYHPLYVNTDVTDSGTDYYMDFTLTPEVVGVPLSNTYTITATSVQDSNVSVSWTVTVNSTATIVTAYDSNTVSTKVGRGNNAVTYNLTTALTAVTPTTGTTVTESTSRTFTANLSLTPTTGTNTASTLSTYISKVGSVDGGISWSVTGPSSTTGTTTATVGTGASWNSNETFTWTVPAYRSGSTPSSDPYVTARLVTFGRYSTTAYYSTTQLIKPDGTQVTKSDAAGASTTSGLTGASSGSGDVRNWVRAASHVRMSKVISGTVTRTVDIPIPWKVTNASSTGNPLSSMTVTDSQTKTAADGTVTTYGSGQAIELDQTYSKNSGNSNLDNGTTYTYMPHVTYRADYITWLFTGTYAYGDSTYIGKYIIYDAVTPSLVGGQTAANWGQGYGSAAKGNSIIVPQFNLMGTYTGTLSADASTNAVPALTRVQAVKRAAISTWISHQADVIWAYRFLDDITEDTTTTFDNNSKTTFNTSSTSGSDSAWTILNNTASQGITSSSGNSVTGMNRIAGLFANNSTPLTYATMRGLAQFTDPSSVFNDVETGTDAPSQCMNHFLILFTDGLDNNGGSTQNANTACPYYISTGTSTYKISAVTGNHSLIADTNSVNPFNKWWDLFSWAGIAAHLGDTSLGAPGVDYMNTLSNASRSGSASTFLPLSIGYRGTGTTLTQFDKPHLVTTMTVGVSLGGLVSNTSSPKRSLFIAAAVGDPKVTELADTSILTPFVWDTTANSGNGGKQANSIYFFDATDPDKLSYSLDKAILSAIGASNINTVSNPTTPYIGSALGGEMFIGKFQPPTNGGAVWTGDLLMFATKLVGDTLQILDTTGTATSTVDSTTAQWSAAAALTSNRLWSARTLKTRLPGTTATPNPDLTTFSDTGTAFTATTTGLQNFISQGTNNPGRTIYTVGSTAQKLVTQWVMGGDTTALDSSGRATANRANIMGDIIDSSPAVVEYLWSDVSSSLTTKLSAVNGNRFRLVLVGTNQGWLHAFGEVTKQENATATDATTPIITKGGVDELWAFMPTDFLGYLDQLTVTSNPHRFMVDGSPAIYHLDLPPSSGGSSDGVVEVTSAPGPEKALVIFGLGKGGRSYYALDIHNPFSPSLKWAIVPDEVDVTDSTGNPALQARILARPGAPTITTVQKVIRNMGFSTCTPGVGRITLTDSTGTAIVRDAVFLGGGFSLPEIEANFLDSNNKPTPMGRSVLAVDAYTGMILAAVDLSSSTASIGGVTLTPGPIYRGLVPFEFILNSGMAQRAYFLDYWGGLWSWGSQKTDTTATIGTGSTANPTYKYRIDSSDLSTWTTDGVASSAAGIRLVAKDISGQLISRTQYTTTQNFYSEALYSTLPAPFRVGSFPGKAKTATGPVPATVGIAMVSGDKNNPLDYNYTTATRPSHHRLTVVYDRQDSLAWGTVANPILVSEASSSGVFNALKTAATSGAYTTANSYQYGDLVITPNSADTSGTSTYFLNPTDPANTKFGFIVNFPNQTTTTTIPLIPKGINSPAVVSGSLYYSYFFPTKADPCTGGTGYTYSNLMCDVFTPIVADSRANLNCTSGEIWRPVGVASDYIALGTRGVIQIGTLAVTNPAAGASATALATKTITGKTSTRYPKARVWRTVH